MNCIAHSQPACIYCKDHSILCCEDLCYELHSKHNTIPINKYKAICSTMVKYHHLQRSAATINCAKIKISSIMDNSLNRILSKIKEIEKNSDLQILRQNSMPTASAQVTLNKKIDDMMKSINGVCMEIELLPIGTVANALVSSQKRPQVLQQTPQLTSVAPIIKSSNESFKSIAFDAITKRCLIAVCVMQKVYSYVSL